MPTSRMEAFSDGVLAVIITIMVLQLQVPEGDTFSALTSTIGIGLLSYVLSFIYVGIYWNNHHHLLHAAERATGGILWANLHLLFWLSLVPFTTSWMDQTSLASVPVMMYGVNLLAAAVAYYILQTLILRAEGPDSAVARALGGDMKTKISPALLLLGIVLAALGGENRGYPVYAALVCFTLVAVIWIVPEKRIERVLAD